MFLRKTEPGLPLLSTVGFFFAALWHRLVVKEVEAGHGWWGEGVARSRAR